MDPSVQKNRKTSRQVAVKRGVTSETSSAFIGLSTTPKMIPQASNQLRGSNFLKRGFKRSLDLRYTFEESKPWTTPNTQTNLGKVNKSTVPKSMLELPIVGRSPTPDLDTKIISNSRNVAETKTTLGDPKFSGKEKNETDLPGLITSKSPTKYAARARKNGLDASAEQFKDHFTGGGYRVKINKGKVTSIDKLDAHYLEQKMFRNTSSLDGGWGEDFPDSFLSQI
jgi:hypothetical protein